VFDPSNVARPEYWFDKPLKFTAHAKERCLDRAILPKDFLPINSRLIDCERDANKNIKALCFKVNERGDCYIVSNDGIVITVFSCKDDKYDTYVYRKNERRYHVSYLNAYFGHSSHNLIPRKHIKD
jgi:hypothetical protein